MDFTAAQSRLPEGADEEFWLAVRANLTRVSDAAEWLRVANGPVEPVIEDADFLAEAASLLPPAPWDAGTWKVWTSAVKDATGRKGKSLFMPLRLALTGMERGPELDVMLLIIGRDRVLKRLGAIEKAA